uniref:hypothetical protein n=1 Tax=Neorhizobium sp. EC2-8 TaxID=3129230 RepID=UPI00310136C4
MSVPYATGHKTVSPAEASAAILTMLEGITPEQTGGYVAYDGNRIDGDEGIIAKAESSVRLGFSDRIALFVNTLKLLST